MNPKSGESLKLLFTALSTSLAEAVLFLWFTRDYHQEWLGAFYMRIWALVGSIIIFLIAYLPVLANNPKRPWLVCFAILVPLNTIYLSILGRL